MKKITFVLLAALLLIGLVSCSGVVEGKVFDGLFKVLKIRETSVTNLSATSSKPTIVSSNWTEIGLPKGDAESIYEGGVVVGARLTAAGRTAVIYY